MEGPNRPKAIPITLDVRSSAVLVLDPAVEVPTDDEVRWIAPLRASHARRQK